MRRKESSLSPKKNFSLAIATITHARDSIEHEDFRLSFLSSAIRFYDETLASSLRKIAPSMPSKRPNSVVRKRSNVDSLHASKRIQIALRPLIPTEIARLQHATLLFYWLGQQRSYLWLITPEKVSLFSMAVVART